MKINPIIAALAFIFGLGGAFAAYSISGLSAELITNGSITLVASILGLLGIYLFEKDYKIAIIQYIVCGLGVLIGTSLFGVLGFAFYLIAAIVAYVEREKSGSKANGEFDELYFYGDSNEIKNRYPNFPTNKAKNSLYYAIPVLTFIIIILVGVFGSLSYANDMQNKGQGIEITELSTDLKTSYGYYTGGIQATLTSKRDIENAQVKGVWYASDGTQIDQTYDTNMIGDIKADQKYKINIPYYKESNNRPAKVVIEVYESYGSSPIYNMTVNLN